MNKAKFSALIYREWLIARSKFCIYLFSSVCASVMGILLILSFKHGNLAKIPETMYAFVLDTCLTIAQYMPVLISGFLIFSVSESAVRDEFAVWRRFRMSTPVKPWKLAIAKVSVMAVFCVVSLTISFVSVWIINIIIDRDIDKKTASFILGVILVTAIFSVIFQIAVMLFHTMDKAGIAVCGALFLIFAFVYLIFKDLSQEELLEKLSGLTESMLPFMPVLYLLLFTASFLACTAILRRREK